MGQPPNLLGGFRIERTDSEGGGLVADIADTAIAPVTYDTTHTATFTESLTPPSLDGAALSTSYWFEFVTDWR
jgi:hypothetical protein